MMGLEGLGLRLTNPLRLGHMSVWVDSLGHVLSLRISEISYGCM